MNRTLAHASTRSRVLHIALPILAVVASLVNKIGPAAYPAGAPIVLVPLVAALIVGTVFVVVRHAEAVAEEIGEPYGTLVLTGAVTAIEASVIISMMLHGDNNPELARESVFSTVMIVTTGVVGVCLTLGGLRHRQQSLVRQGTSAFLAVLVALSVLCLILPNYTLAGGPGSFSSLQLAFVSLLALLLYGSFVFAQMTRHRDDFLEEITGPDQDNQHPSAMFGLWPSVILLVVGLIGIVLLAEDIAVFVEDTLAEHHVTQPDAIVGAFIATLVLLPETASAIKAALRNQLQHSLNIALGSACATIGLTIPVVAAASLISGRQLTLGLGGGDTVLLVLAFAVCTLSFGTGRTTVLTGLVHLVVFLAYLILIGVP